MKKIMLAALFAVGVGFAGLSGASAAPAAATGINGSAANLSLIEQTAYACRRVRICRRAWINGRYVQRCGWQRICRVW